MTIRSKPDVREHQSFFGMPEDVKFCKKCTYSNQKPNSTVEFRAKRGDLKTGIVFSSGICSACQYNEQKNSSIDWDQRRQKLQDLCDKYRSRNGSYDCLVPGSGGKDSFYAAIMLKEKFDMNPLTVTWAQTSTQIGVSIISRHGLTQVYPIFFFIRMVSFTDT